MGECYYTVELDSEKPHHYLIYSVNNQTNAKVLFGRIVVRNTWL